MRRALTVGLLAIAVTACAPDKHDPSDPATLGGPATEGPATTFKPPSTGGTITFGSPSSPASTGPAEPTQTVVPGKHDQGPCPAPGVDTGSGTRFIVGTPGDDTLTGTSKGETICGLGGNDTIRGGGGQDTIYGGTGDDVLIGGLMIDFLYGGDGDDILRGGNGIGKGAGYGKDFLYGDSRVPQFDDTGNDVLMGSTASLGEEMHGGPGNDTLAPTPQPVLHNDVFAGPGSDLVMTMNARGGTGVDVVALEEPDATVSAKVSSRCKMTVPIHLGDKGSKGQYSCDLPWPKKLTGMDKVLPVSVTVDSTGKVTMDVTLYKNLGKLSIEQWRNMIGFQASVASGADGCLCDPLLEEPPPKYDLPWDKKA